MLVVAQSAVRDTDGIVVDVGNVLHVVLHIVEPRTLTAAAILGEHPDADVGVLTLLEVAGVGELNLGLGPVRGIGVGGESVTTFNGDSVGRDRPADVDAASGGDGESTSGVFSAGGEPCSWDGTGNGSGNNGGLDEDVGKHGEVWKMYWEGGYVFV